MSRLKHILMVILLIVILTIPMWHIINEVQNYFRLIYKGDAVSIYYLQLVVKYFRKYADCDIRKVCFKDTLLRFGEYYVLVSCDCYHGYGIVLYTYRPPDIWYAPCDTVNELVIPEPTIPRPNMSRCFLLVDPTREKCLRKYSALGPLIAVAQYWDYCAELSPYCSTGIIVYDPVELRDFIEGYLNITPFEAYVLPP